MSSKRTLPFAVVVAVAALTGCNPDRIAGVPQAPCPVGPGCHSELPDDPTAENESRSAHRWREVMRTRP